MRKALFYGAALIAGYLVLVNSGGFKNDVGAAGTGSVNLIKALQGR